MSVARAARPLLSLRAQGLNVSQAFLRLAPRAGDRNLSTTCPTFADESGKNKGLFKSLLHGSESAKQDGLTAQSHSKRVGRGKYIHEIQRHVVRPDKVDEYITLLGEYFPKLAADEGIPCRLIGSWQVHIGELETFCK